MNNENALNLRAVVPSAPPNKRKANELFEKTFAEYGLIEARLKRDDPQQENIANLFCLVAGKHYDVFQVSASGDIFTMSARDADGNVHRLISPAELVAFDVVISKRTKKKEVGGIDWGVKFIGFEVESKKGN